jgi:fumarylacetoacetate (FAA) hydrolase
MKLATLDNGTRDGQLVVVSRDLRTAALADGRFPTLQAALEDWASALPSLRTLYDELNGGRAKAALAFAAVEARAPLPRSYQWLDASAFPSHGALMSKAFNLAHPESDRPLMYQGLSHRFLGPSEDAPFVSEADGIDFEGEFAIITDDVPMGISPDDALSHVKLLAQVNDWSLRGIAPIEMKTGFGWIRAKPACAMAPVVITPDELGEAWSDGRVQLRLAVDWNGQRFGAAHAGEMEVGFHDLIAHAASTRDLCAGTIIGSGTVSNANYREVGSSCIAERRGSEIVEFGAPRTDFMAFGDRVRMEALAPDGSTPFGAIDQRVIQARGGA